MFGQKLKASNKHKVGNVEANTKQIDKKKKEKENWCCIRNNVGLPKNLTKFWNLKRSSGPQNQGKVGPIWGPSFGYLQNFPFTNTPKQQIY